VPPNADEAFLADWRRERAGATLYRALRDDAAVRFVSVGPAVGRDDAYELVHEDGTAGGGSGVTQISAFAVPAEADDEFLSAWHAVHAIAAARRGYLGTRLYRAVGLADVRFVAIARWSSPLMVARTAQQPEFERATAALSFASEAALYARL